MAGEPTTRRRLFLAVVGAVLAFGFVAVPPAGVVTVANAASYSKPSGLSATVAANAVGLHWKAVKNAPAYRV